MFAEVPSNLQWLTPWEPVDDSNPPLVAELKKELGSNHVLHGLEFVAIGRRVDCDDVLFGTSDQTKPLAVVHLTWTGNTEADPRWPTTAIYKDWQDWIDQCLLRNCRES
jgi:hypothetical protein